MVYSNNAHFTHNLKVAPFGVFKLVLMITGTAFHCHVSMARCRAAKVFKHTTFFSHFREEICIIRSNTMEGVSRHNKHNAVVIEILNPWQNFIELMDNVFWLIRFNKSKRFSNLGISLYAFEVLRATYTDNFLHHPNSFTEGSFDFNLNVICCAINISCRIRPINILCLLVQAELDL
ncbi:hypothetical protein DA11_04570 [Aeromonas caviae]|nr:hypothetical protein DA11_04570 [Aeromonas caviae]